MGDAAIRVIQAFKKADSDGNGVISREELTEVLSLLAPGKWTEHKVTKLIADIDTNGDGLVQYEEFVAFLFSKEDTSSTAQKAKKHLDRLDDGQMKVVKPAEIVDEADEEEQGMLKTQSSKSHGGGDGYGRIIIFFDVDGVLNSKGAFDSDDEAEEEEDGDTTDSETGMKVPRTIVDPRGRWAARLSFRCIKILKRLLESFTEKIEKKDEGLALPVEKGLTDAKAGSSAKEKGPQTRNRARLVLTSTWRFSEDQTAFVKSALADAGIAEEIFLGGTAVVEGATRGEEVMHYIGAMAAACRDVAAWVAIDSDDLNLQALPDAKKVQPSEVCGLNADFARQARELLVAQDAAWHEQYDMPPPGYPSEFDDGSRNDGRKQKRTKSVIRRGAGEKKKKNGLASSKKTTLEDQVAQAAEEIVATRRRRQSLSAIPTHRNESPDGRSHSPDEMPVGHMRTEEDSGRAGSKHRVRRKSLAIASPSAEASRSGGRRPSVSAVDNLLVSLGQEVRSPSASGRPRRKSLAPEMLERSTTTSSSTGLASAPAAQRRRTPSAAPSASDDESASRSRSRKPTHEEPVTRTGSKTRSKRRG